MNLLSPALLALVTAVLLILFGYWLHGRTETAVTPAPPAPAWLSREEAVDQLRALRGELETDGEFGQAQALLLFDCCAFLGFDEGEIQAVIGAAWFDAIEEPADV
jgi:hypothetical protein